MKSGDLVQLKSGGPVMTVGWVEHGGAQCNWFDERNELKSAHFATSQLRLVDDPA